MVEKLAEVVDDPAVVPVEAPSESLPDGDEPLVPGGVVDPNALLTLDDEPVVPTEEAPAEAPVTPEESEEQPSEESSEEVDWEARAKEAEEKLASTERDKESVLGNLRKLREQSRGERRTSEDLDEMRAEIAAIPDLLKAFAESLGTNDPEQIREAIDKTTAATRGNATQTAFTSRYNAKMERLQSTLTDLPQDTQTEIVGAWNEEHARQSENKAFDIGPFADILDLARDAQQELRDEARAKEVDERVEKRVAEARTKMARTNGLLDIDSGPASAGGELSDDAFLASGRMDTPAEIERALRLSAERGGYGRSRR